jgi:uncharacterized protein (TIGR00369 family)
MQLTPEQHGFVKQLTNGALVEGADGDRGRRPRRPRSGAGGMTRSRTITWEDPHEAFAAAAGVSGIEYLRAIGDGRVPKPPIAELLGFEGIEVEEGRAVFAAVPQEYHYNPIGVVHGGLAMTLLDSAMGCAVQTMLPAGSGYTTLEVKVNFARPITRDTGRIVCEASVVHGGRTVATAEGRVFAQESGKLLAHGSTTCLILSANGG